AKAEIKAIAHDGIKRVKIEGPDIAVDPQVAQTLGMAFAELTLNALAHGALSTASGEILLTWKVEPNDDFSMSWTEVGGPSCQETAPRGYGMAVIERFVAQGLKASSTINFAADGVRWNLTAPMANIGQLSVNKN
ncbi:MAG: histidine kinase, partial [Hyphomicrobium sp.]